MNLNYLYISIKLNTLYIICNTIIRAPRNPFFPKNFKLIRQACLNAQNILKFLCFIYYLIVEQELTISNSEMDYYFQDNFLLSHVLDFTYGDYRSDEFDRSGLL